MDRKIWLLIFLAWCFGFCIGLAVQQQIPRPAPDAFTELDAPMEVCFRVGSKEVCRAGRIEAWLGDTPEEIKDGERK